MARTIRNGRAYPKSVKAAVVAEIISNPVKKRQDIAVERNMSTTTVAKWASEASIQLSNNQHPNTAAGVKARWASYQAAKQFNTPTVKYRDPVKKHGILGIEYKGKMYV